MTYTVVGKELQALKYCHLTGPAKKDALKKIRKDDRLEHLDVSIMERLMDQSVDFYPGPEWFKKEFKIGKFKLEGALRRLKVAGYYRTLSRTGQGRYFGCVRQFTAVPNQWGSEKEYITGEVINGARITYRVSNVLSTTGAPVFRSPAIEDSPGARLSEPIKVVNKETTDTEQTNPSPLQSGTTNLSVKKVEQQKAEQFFKLPPLKVTTTQDLAEVVKEFRKSFTSPEVKTHGLVLNAISQDILQGLTFHRAGMTPILPDVPMYDSQALRRNQTTWANEIMRTDSIMARWLEFFARGQWTWATRSKGQCSAYLRRRAGTCSGNVFGNANMLVLLEKALHELVSHVPESQSYALNCIERMFDNKFTTMRDFLVVLGKDYRSRFKHGVFGLHEGSLFAELINPKDVPKILTEEDMLEAFRSDDAEKTMTMIVEFLLRPEHKRDAEWEEMADLLKSDLIADRFPSSWFRGWYVRNFQALVKHMDATEEQIDDFLSCISKIYGMNFTTLYRPGIFIVFARYWEAGRKVLSKLGMAHSEQFAKCLQTAMDYLHYVDCSDDQPYEQPMDFSCYA